MSTHKGVLLGVGFSRSNLHNMRSLYSNYPICQALTGKLSFTHYCELFTISDKASKAFYEQEAISSNWSVGELKRKINISLFERLLLSEGNEITVTSSENNNDYISLTDMTKGFEGGSALIE